MNQTKDIGRNDPCPCGSGRKYKHCCLDKDEAALRKARAKEAEKAAKEAEKAAKAAEKAAKASKKTVKKAAKTAGEPAKAETPDTGHPDPNDPRSAHHHPPRPRSEQPWKRGTAQAHPSQRKGMHRKIGSK
jgi:uncharacterized protein YecA (UPF0149 family)